MDIRKMERDTVITWFTYECIVPVVLISLIWPFAVLFGVSNSFSEVFSKGDLMLLAALLLLNVYREIIRAKNHNEIDRLSLIYPSSITIILAITTLVVYTAMRFGALLKLPEFNFFNFSTNELLALICITTIPVVATLSLYIRQLIVMEKINNE